MSIEDKLISSGAVLFGSAALGVATDSSDTDYVVLRKNFDTTNLQECCISKYFKVTPATGYNTMAVKVHVGNNSFIDILILEHQSDLDIVQNAVAALSKLPKYMLLDKYIRIKLFEKALLHYGFMEEGTPEVTIDIDSMPF